MIQVTNLARHKIWVNCDLIRMMESAPDTILCFVDGSRLPVRDTPEEIQKKIIEFKVQIQFHHTRATEQPWK